MPTAVLPLKGDQNAHPSTLNSQTFDLQGRPVTTPHKGIYIQNHRIITRQ
jgi:hypothetical protein